jgi:hypothetical protein
MDKEIKKGVKRDNRRWVDEQAQRAEEAERWGDTKQLYDITRGVQVLRSPIFFSQNWEQIDTCGLV